MNEELQKACEEILAEALQEITQTTSYPQSIVSCVTNGPLLQMVVRQQTSRAGQADHGHILAVLRRIVPKHMEAFTQFRRLCGADTKEGWWERHLEDYGKELGGLRTGATRIRVELTADELALLVDALETLHDRAVATLCDLPEEDKAEHIAFTGTLADLAAKLSKLG